ncbi:EF hand domain [Trypanosoma vivax]|uniref:EF-hand domain-containing protein n=1 Tax=Trypanosoma vivax (strain Y486) TaxID=1055687 RepID=G0UDB4_TRYVY|nr:hypothetical protein TRVL_08071 [Trypanosoma vivax]KAH8605125.1 EF hand domain [Trypanosoma vivax]CCC53825.1 conserved hypothetical protein [Trypanosoma vivax Y486]
MFLVQVAADIFNNKVNFELSFPSRPTIDEVKRAAETAFSNEIALRRPDNVPVHNFHVSRIKMYDEDKDKWTDLLSESQLVDYCQLYAFQPENPWHKESQKEIPAAVKPPASGKRFTSGPLVAQSSRGTPNGSLAVQGALAPYNGNRSPVSHRSESQPVRYTSLQTSTSNALVPRVPNDVTPEEKLRVLFAELDVKGNRVLDLEDFSHGFATFNLNFSSSTIEDLFEKGDANRDGKITFSEFERFGRLYPIMMDCLYFRSRAFWEEEQIKRTIQAERQAVKQAEHNVEQARQALDEAAQDADVANNAVASADADLKDRTDRLRDLTRDMDNAKRERERAVREKKEREKELADVREREKEMRKEAQEIAREAERLDKRAFALSGDAAAADEKVRQLEKALEEARRASERAHLTAEQAARDADVVKLRVQDAARDVDEAVREIPRAEDAVRIAEGNVTTAEQNARELEGISRALAREIEEASQRRDQSERAVEEARNQLHAKERHLEEAKQHVAEREHSVRAKEMELADQRKQREIVSQHERTLIDQELRLREQRDSLEERETKLMSEASSFLGNLRTHLQGSRPYSRE